MKRGATREEIIRTTQELISRNGIRAVRVDEIAQTLGISKRTLYETFADKTELVTACLDAMGRRQQQRVIAGTKRRSGNPLRCTFRLADEYIDSLYTVDRSFLSDIRRKVIFAEHFHEHQAFWHDTLERHLEYCRDAKLLLPEIETKAFADRVLGTLLELRLNRATREELGLFCRTILRGAATRQGIELIDGK